MWARLAGPGGRGRSAERGGRRARPGPRVAAPSPAESTAAVVMDLLAEHVPLALLADLAAVDGPVSQAILESEGLPERRVVGRPGLGDGLRGSGLSGRRFAPLTPRRW